MMTLKKLMVWATALVGLGTISSLGGLAVLPASRAQDPRPGEPASTTKQSSTKDAPAKAIELSELELLVRQTLDVARRHFEDQRQLQKTGRITIDSYIDACEEIERIELRFATSQEARNAIRRQYLTRLKDIETLRRGEVDAGMATSFDLDEIRLQRMQAEIDLSTPTPEEQSVPAILKRLSDLERKVEQLEKRNPAPAGRR